MSLTASDLDRLCGGAPPRSKRCPVPGCDRKFGPYYAVGHLKQTLMDHVAAQHAELLSAMQPRHVPNAPK